MSNVDLPTDPVPSSESVTPTSLAARMGNVLAAPVEVFDEVRASRPQLTNWLVPLILAMVVGWLGSWLVNRDPVIRQQVSDIQEQTLQKLAHKLNWTDQQLKEQRQKADQQQSTFGGIGQSAGPLLLPAISLVWWAFLIWIGGNKLLGGEFRFVKAVEVTGLASLIGVLHSIVTTLLILGSVDVMGLWSLLVLSVGLARLARTSLVKAAGWLFLFWFAGKALGIVLALLWARFIGA